MDKKPVFLWLTLFLCALYSGLGFVLVHPYLAAETVPIASVLAVLATLRLTHLAALSLQIWLPLPECPKCCTQTSWWLLHIRQDENTEREPDVRHLCKNCEQGACEVFTDLTAVTYSKTGESSKHYQLRGWLPFAKWVEASEDSHDGRARMPGPVLGLLLLFAPPLLIIITG